jgi:hypothetical protein
MWTISGAGEQQTEIVRDAAHSERKLFDALDNRLLLIGRDYPPRVPPERA